MLRTSTQSLPEMKILVFAEGTILMHLSPEVLTREKRVAQSKRGGRAIRDYRHYVPTGNAVQKLLAWKKQGAKIYYLTSRTALEEIADINQVLERYQFPDKENLLYRKEGQEYKDVGEKLMPDIIIEDDCESIGGEVEMVYPHIRKELKSKIKSIMVKEFGGIDHLPSTLDELINH